MKVKNANASSKKTRKIIKEKFAELMQEKKNLSHITVTELVRRAEITRASFYTHYDSIYDVAQDLQNETMEILVNNSRNIQSLIDIEYYLDDVFGYLKEQENIYKMILASDDPNYFTHRLNILINKRLHEFLIATHHEDLFLKMTFYVDGCMDMLIKYFRNELSISLDELNEFIKEVFKTLFIH